MSQPMVVMGDAEQILVTYLRTLIPLEAGLTNYKIGTKVAPGTSPKMFIQVRRIGGDEDQPISERARTDIRIWDQPGADYQRMQNARRVLAHLRRDLGCQVMAAPINLPDPADPSILHTLFTIEHILRGDPEWP